MNIEGECEYSEGWLQKFKKHHGIKYLKICGEKASADDNAAERYIDEFVKMVSNENLNPDKNKIKWEHTFNFSLTLLPFQYCFL